MPRAFASSLMSAMMALSLVWGGCVSCPQFFMFSSASGSCCNKAGKCERPSKTAPPLECKRLPLELTGFASVHFDLAVTPVSGVLVSMRPNPAAPAPDFQWAAVGHSPPDLQLRNSVFLI